MATFNALKQLIPQPEPARTRTISSTRTSRFGEAAAIPKFLFSSPAKPTTPHEYMLAIAKQINEDFKRLCDDYKTLKSDLNSLLGQFTSVEGQAKSAMEGVSKDIH